MPTVVTNSSVIAFMAFAVGFAVSRFKGFLVADLAACAFFSTLLSARRHVSP
jgi:hypothetical protein